MDNFENNVLSDNVNIDNKRKKGNIFKIIIVIILLLCLVVLGIFLYSKFNKKEVEPTDIYEKAYFNLNFKEDTSLKKLYCTKDESNGTEVINKKTMIYYFENDKVITYIEHNDIVVSDSYMDYYDEMYENYDESLKKDYNYKNVKSGIEKGDNQILVTIITTKSDEENSLGLPNIINFDAAKQGAIAQGYSCK